MSAPARPRLTLSQARRVALRAQGLDRSGGSGGPVTLRDLTRVVERIGLLQIDSVNVLARAHLVPLYARLGPYDTGLLDRAASRPPRRLVESWAHEASYVPPATYSLLAWRRRARAERPFVVRGQDLRGSGVVAEVRELVAEHGPVTARQVHAALSGHRPRPGAAAGGWWEWSAAKSVLEWMFATGEVAVAGRTAAFERSYDLAARVLPDVALSEPGEEESVRALVRIAARAHGVGTLRCFTDYFRLAGRRTGQHVRAAVEALVDEGELERVTVAGWDREVYLDARAVVPRRAEGCTLLSPFDPLVFERRRLAELFGTDYRIEIYTPAHLRVHGYYCLPLLLGEEVVARVDLRLDRAAGVLEVRAAHEEPGIAAPTEAVTAALAGELDRLAAWLTAERVVVVPGAPGRLSGPLQGALSSRGGREVRSGCAVAITAGSDLAYDGRRSVSTAPSGAPGPVVPSPSGAGL